MYVHARERRPAPPPPVVRDVVHSPGHQLDAATRSHFQARFGHDFADVRVHADTRAARSAAAVGALAYTVGHDIVFATGQYQPRTSVGKRLIAHELAHVVQQRPAAGRSTVGGPAPEAEADHAAEAAVGTGSVRATAGQLGQPALQRQEAPLAQPDKIWYMLSPPPVVMQHSLTCWAASLSSWLQAHGTVKPTFQEIIERYAGTSCIDTDNALPFSTMTEVYAEWGAHFTEFSTPGSVTFDLFKTMLQRHGWLLLAGAGGGLGHVRVVYGCGIDNTGMPNPNFISVMDPLTGGYANVSISSITLPIRIGIAGAPVRPAACRSRPGAPAPP